MLGVPASDHARERGEASPAGCCCTPRRSFPPSPTNSAPCPPAGSPHPTPFVAHFFDPSRHVQREQSRGVRQPLGYCRRTPRHYLSTHYGRSRGGWIVHG